MTIQTYQPTAELSVRDKTTYYTAFKNFFEELASNNDLISVSFDDENFMISVYPTSSNINARRFQISWQNRNDHNGFYCNGYFFYHKNYSADISFFIYSNNDEFTIGITEHPIIFGIFSATNYYDGSKIHFAIETSDETNGWSVATYINSNTSSFSLNHVHPTFYRESAGITDVYRFIEFPLSNTLYISDNIFYVDGGLSLTPSQFTVNGVEYVTFMESRTNICYRLS